MDWLNDKKNQPIIAAIAVVVILLVGFCLYWFNFRRPPVETPPAETAQQATVPPEGPQPAAQPTAAGTPQAAAPPPASAAGAPQPAAPAQPTALGAPQPAAPAQPTAPGTPAQPAPAAGAAVQVAKVTPMETWRTDPFQPIGYKPGKTVKVRPPIRDLFPTELLFPPEPKGKGKVKPEIQQPPRRMAGILLGDRVFAIIETNGVPQVVQPGDYTTDRLAIVEKIEPGKVVLKTVDEKPRYITVKMAASPVSPTPTPSQPTVPGQPGPSLPPGMPPEAAPPPPGARPAG